MMVFVVEGQRERKETGWRKRTRTRKKGWIVRRERRVSEGPEEEGTREEQLEQWMHVVVVVVGIVGKRIDDVGRQALTLVTATTVA